jgi:hypothetical protein
LNLHCGGFNFTYIEKIDGLKLICLCCDSPKSKGNKCKGKEFEIPEKNQTNKSVSFYEENFTEYLCEYYGNEMLEFFEELVYLFV